MDIEKSINLFLKIESDSGETLHIKSIRVNDQFFYPTGKELVSENEQEVVKNDLNIPLSTIGVATLIKSEDIESTPNPSIAPPSMSQNALKPGEGYATLEEFGGDSFYKMFWGNLTYTPIDAQKSKVTYEGAEDVFDSTYEGKWLEPSRIHKCSFEFPETGRNYFPGAISVVYSRVLEVLDSKNLVVDFPYNGTDADRPKSISKQDGIFFFDNKFAIQSWALAVKSVPNMRANSGQIYASLGSPSLKVASNSSLNFSGIGDGPRPALHIMMSDAFSGDKFGKGGESSASFKETFGEGGALFVLPSSGKVEIDFDWQYIPPTYAQKVVQYGSPIGLFFYDAATDSKQYGLKRVRNFDQFRIRNEMERALGFVRPGVTFSMPNQGYCNGGGIHNGRDITEFCTYRFEGDWFSKDPNNMKARTSGGLRIEWIGKSKDEPGNFIEMESMKAYRFDDLKFKFLTNRTLEVDDPTFTWYHLASQEWTGGNSASSEYTHLLINGCFVGLNTNGDFWLVNGDEDLVGRGFSAHRVSLFDKIPAPGDLISQNLDDLKKNALIGKLSDTKFEIWGWSVQKGDKLSFGGKTFTIIQSQRKFKTWEQFSSQYQNPPARIKRSDRRITYTEIELDKEIASPVNEIIFKVESSVLQSVLNGNPVTGCSAIWSFGNDAPGHLMYTDYNVNLLMENVNIHGLIRATARPLWVDTTQALSGSISSIPVSALGASVWNAGDKLQLAHPESGLITEVELIVGSSGNAGNLLIKPITLAQEFPAKSIVTALYSLCSEARFDHVNFVKEDLSPSYSQRIDYRPQGLRLRQLLTSDDAKRLKIIGGRLSWYSNFENRFEPEIELTEKPHLVNPSAVVNVLLNPVIPDHKGVLFGHQYKQNGKEEIYIQNRVVVRDGKKVDLSNSVIGSDLYLEGNGEVILNGLTSKQYVANGKDSGVGFNVIIEDKFMDSKDLTIQGKSGNSGLIVNKAYPVGVLKIDLTQWKLAPGLFNNGGFQTKQNKSDSNYSNFIKISG